MVMKLAAGHSVSNMFSSYIPPPFSYTGVFFLHVDKEMMARFSQFVNSIELVYIVLGKLVFLVYLRINRLFK
ncbi:unnamed protein product [Macrosiphum euphorbiae]|uniref:Uncharacterized protein n=1 Tax=Macrosiphum euphorbiae TaxID=13131 RepID=A0AAV0VJY1_9HEMI|nr:unnamed protein product [Macrosiphum euphorbiae]